MLLKGKQRTCFFEKKLICMKWNASFPKYSKKNMEKYFDIK